MYGVIITLCSTDSIKNAVTCETLTQFRCYSRFRNFKNNVRIFILWLKAPSLTMWAWRRRKYIFTKDQSVKVKVKVRCPFNILVIFWRFCNTILKVPNRCAMGAFGDLHGSGEGFLRAPQGLTHVQRPFPYYLLMTSSRFVTLLLILTFLICL